LLLKKPWRPLRPPRTPTTDHVMSPPYMVACLINSSCLIRLALSLIAVRKSTSLKKPLDVCVFITAGPMIKLCAGGEGDSEGHVLWIRHPHSTHRYYRRCNRGRESRLRVPRHRRRWITPCYFNPWQEYRRHTHDR
jgi:hypothetical protein